ncbi:transcriptional regulator, MarR family [Frankia torreyi]|uniref:Transcriptional regulator, MarR family n=2 Tax=Frankiaceae TaxID=74712 RepID=A0A0D8BDP1_9ACTN|nr:MULTISPECIES: MarR family transcriptional regulator [Frankia]KJE21517.1 transcriptional regulator, MarR family [Frankia torreyi]KQM03488.1 transcriptional regulator [Frankia sp. CpI1-P]
MSSNSGVGAFPAEPVRWLDEREQRVWRRYLLMTSQLTAQMNRQLAADAGLSLADYEVLVRLTDVPAGRLRVTRLARELSWEQSRLSHHVSRMARRGLVAREECADDGRGALVALTEQGRAAIERAAPAHVAFVRAGVFDALTDAQVDALDAILGSILTALTQ